MSGKHGGGVECTLCLGTFVRRWDCFQGQCSSARICHPYCLTKVPADQGESVEGGMWGAEFLALTSPSSAALTRVLASGRVDAGGTQHLSIGLLTGFLLIAFTDGTHPAHRTPGLRCLVPQPPEGEVWVCPGDLRQQRNHPRP